VCWCVCGQPCAHALLHDLNSHCHVTNTTFFFFFSLLVAGGVHMEVHAALRPVIGQLYMSRVIVRMEKLVE
jgi:hypothetical protein